MFGMHTASYSRRIFVSERKVLSSWFTLSLLSVLECPEFQRIKTSCIDKERDQIFLRRKRYSVRSAYLSTEKGKENLARVAGIFD